MRILVSASIITCLGVVALGVPQTAHADDFVTCSSNKGRHTTCRLPHAGRVQLDDRQSRAQCRQGRDWGYTRHHVWVDNGCRGRFRVSWYGGHHGYDYRGHHHDKHHGNDAAKVAAGALIGAAILGAVIKNRQQQNEAPVSYDRGGEAREVPNWTIGTFLGHNHRYNADVVLRVEPDGRVRATAEGQDVDGWIRGDHLHVSDARFRLTRTSEGFMTAQVGDSSNRVYYHRVR
jgi:hypothetical protein